MNDPVTHSLRLTRVLDAPRDVVFRAWTEPAEMRRWFSPVGYSTPHAEAEARVGGRWRVGMQPPDGDVLYVSGTYREIRPPERIVFTWAWEAADNPFPGETLVTVELHDRDGATELVLTHELLADEKAAEMHRDGWLGCLESLANEMTGERGEPRSTRRRGDAE